MDDWDICGEGGVRFFGRSRERLRVGEIWRCYSSGIDPEVNVDGETDAIAADRRFSWDFCIFHGFTAEGDEMRTVVST